MPKDDNSTIKRRITRRYAQRVSKRWRI